MFLLHKWYTALAAAYGDGLYNWSLLYAVLIFVCLYYIVIGTPSITNRRSVACYYWILNFAKINVLINEDYSSKKML